LPELRRQLNASVIRREDIKYVHPQFFTTHF
jgi:hypothetical protein